MSTSEPVSTLLRPRTMLDLTSSATLILLFLASLVLLTAFLSPTPLLKWLQRKRYQYEVTYSLYMLTPTEKFIFNSFLFLFVSMIIIAVALYLPEHAITIGHRVFYYVVGDVPGNAPGVDVIATENKPMAGSAPGLAGTGGGYMEP